MAGLSQLPLAFSHRPALGQGDFLLAPCNTQAVEWIDVWPDWPDPALILYGPKACGKTHLAHVWQLHSQAVFVDLEALVNCDINALFEKARAVVVEDAERGAGRKDCEEALFHLYNLARENKAYLLITALSPPGRWGLALPDLSSRLKAAPAVAIGAPDDRLIAAVLAKLFADRQLVVPETLIDYLLVRMERSFEAAHELVERLDLASLVRKGPLSLALARQVLGEMEDKPGSEKAPAPEPSEPPESM